MPTRFSLVRISIRDLVADRKSLVRNSGVGGGGQNLILTEANLFRFSAESGQIDNLDLRIVPPSAIAPGPETILLTDPIFFWGGGGFGG